MKIFSGEKYFAFLAACLGLTCGETISHEWTIAPRMSLPPLSPDCFTARELLIVEEQCPGPVLRAKVGDTVHIKWTNMHPSEGVSIHYHGLLMQDQPYADGTGGVSTCVVGPMQTFEHEFVVDNAGTHYWHGHTSLDRMDCLQGLIVVEDPSDPEYEALQEMYDEERILFLQDWYHKSGPGLRTTLDSGVWIGSPQSILINGKGRFTDCIEDPSLAQCDEEGCSVENYVPAIQVDPGKTYLFRVVNAAGLLSLNLAIAGHNMTVVSADGVYVEPFEVSSLEVNVAQRYSVLVTASAAADTSHWISVTAPRMPPGWAYLQYGDAAPPAANATMPATVEDGPSIDAMLKSKSIDPEDKLMLHQLTLVDRSAVVVTTQSRHSAVGMRYTSNNVSNSLHSPVPLAALAHAAVNRRDAEPWPGTRIPGTVLVPDQIEFPWNYSNTPRDEGVSSVHNEHGLAVFQFVKGQMVELVFQSTVSNRGSAGSHAWHLHGHHFYIMGQGKGIYDRQRDIMTYNYENPIRRDTFSVWGLGWTAIRFRANNVGAWPMHCTFAPHAVTGMGFTVLTSPDMLPEPPQGLQSCLLTSLKPETDDSSTEDPVGDVPEEASQFQAEKELTASSASRHGIMMFLPAVVLVILATGTDVGNLVV